MMFPLPMPRPIQGGSIYERFQPPGAGSLGPLTPGQLQAWLPSQRPPVQDPTFGNVQRPGQLPQARPPMPTGGMGNVPPAGGQPPRAMPFAGLASYGQRPAGQMNPAMNAGFQQMGMAPPGQTPFNPMLLQRYGR